MLKNIFTACLLLIGTLCLAQQTVQRSNKLANSNITEAYSVLKSDKQVKQGQYTATANNITLAQGNYLNGQREGIWMFYNLDGKLIQTYNYTDNQLTFADSTDTKTLQYVMTGTKTDDDVTLPVKIGGSYSLQPTFLPKVLTQAIRKDFGSIKTASFTHIYNLNNRGQVINHQVKVSATGNSKTYLVDDSELDRELTRFAPATVNNKAVACRVIANVITMGLDSEQFTVVPLSGYNNVTRAAMPE